MKYDEVLEEEEEKKEVVKLSGWALERERKSLRRNLHWKQAVGVCKDKAF